MKVLVTGGAGYVGSHTCKALARAGFAPVVYDDLSRGHAEAVKFGPLEVGDIRDEERLRSVISRHRPEAVLHFAGLAYVAESFSRMPDYYDVNVVGVWRLLAAMREARISRLVFSSSCAVYGDTCGQPCDEAMPLQPINPYGASKAAAEQLIRMHQAAHGLRAFVLRYFNAAGADPEGELGENHDPETHLIPLAIKAALGGPPLRLLGVDYPTPDGSAIRDYVHVCDLAEAHVAAVTRLIEGAESETINLCAGRPASVLEICDAVASAIGAAPTVHVEQRRPGDPAKLCGINARARTLLDWTPQRSDIDTIVRDAAIWLAGKGVDAQSTSRPEYGQAPG